MYLKKFKINSMLLRKIIANSDFRHTNKLYFSKINPLIEANVQLSGQNYVKDDYTNVTEKIGQYLGRNLHSQPNHPIQIVANRVTNYFYSRFKAHRGTPAFSVYNNLNPIVTVEQNFDSLLIPELHVSRSKSDCYYVNRQYLLRAHMTAHQSELLKAGLDNFLMIGDVYRRDEIDRTHYPVFHQIDGVRIKSRRELFPNDDDLEIFELGNYTENIGSQSKQKCHTLEAVKLIEFELKNTLLGLAQTLFGTDFKYRWVDTYFPFTQPSWELEVFHNDQWMEVLGCGIIKQPILSSAGVNNKVGWAFGIGIERIAMCLFKIPDIRLFWSKDSGFLNQFDGSNPKITYKPISQYPQCTNDISFWLPNSGEYSENDFYDLVRNIGGDIIEQVTLKDDFTHPKSGKRSHCYRIVYRHMERTLNQEEVNIVHKKIEEEAAEKLFVQVR